MSSSLNTIDFREDLKVDGRTLGFKAKLNAFRMHNTLSLKETADALCVGLSTITRWLDYSTPALPAQRRTVQRIAHVMGVHPSVVWTYIKRDDPKTVIPEDQKLGGVRLIKKSKPVAVGRIDHREKNDTTVVKSSIETTEPVVSAPVTEPPKHVCTCYTDEDKAIMLKGIRSYQPDLLMRIKDTSESLDWEGIAPLLKEYMRVDILLAKLGE